jgi:ATP-dependent Clp protease ATP-binding subunit ClpA
MSYKGHDLDLRPVSAGPTRVETASEPPRAGEAGGSRDRARREPVAVALTVLDCCNAAFDVARVHGAREVRLEHLLHALTRAPAAGAVLDEVGIRADQLRRQTAMAIAAEAPGASADTAGAPVASAPFEALLRRAAGEAAKRQSAATLQDILRALLDSPVAMLLRQAADPQRLAGWRAAASRQAPSAVAPLPADPALTVPDAVTTRLGELEAALQSLRAGLAADRAAMSDILRDLRTELAALRASRASEGAAAPRAPADSAIEASLQHLREEAERRWAQATERHQALEASVRAQMEKSDEARKSNHDVLSAIYDALLKLGTNQHELGEHFSAWRTETSGDLGIISSRVDQLDQAALDMLGQLSDDLHALQRRKRGPDSAQLRENLKRWLQGTGSSLATNWRKRLPAYRAPAPRDPDPPTPDAVLAREPDAPPADKPGRADEPGKPS